MLTEQSTEFSSNAVAGSELSVVVLAAGSSRRMGRRNKLLVPVNDRAMVEIAVTEALKIKPREVVVVIGHQADRIRRRLAGYDIRLVENLRYREGLAASLSRGIGALSATTPGAMVMLSDMPFVGYRQLQRLTTAFQQCGGEKILLPVFEGRRGNPLVWPQRYFTEMQSLSGDRGARVLLDKYRQYICEVEMDDGNIFLDIDTPEQLLALEQR